jgi:hypothetical protein
MARRCSPRRPFLPWRDLATGQAVAQSPVQSSDMSDSDDPFLPVDDGDEGDDPSARAPDGKLTLAAKTTFEESKAVLFVDLLGFSRLTIKCPVIRDDFWIMDRPNRADFLCVRLEATDNNRLIETYMHFNMALDDAIEQALLRDVEVKAIAFSDSAFIASEHVYDAIDIAQDIWTTLLKEHIPVRFGVAYGSFLVMRFRSDVSLRAETHAAQFAGKAVVWSHAACELSGLKGLRIFVHPSAAEVIADPNAGGSEFRMFKTAIPLGEQERSEHVTSEVMLLNKNHPKVKDVVDRQWWRCVQTMHQRAIEDSAPPGALAHYAATFDALNRMRERLGRSAFHPLEEFPMQRKPPLRELFTQKPATTKTDTERPTESL